MRSFIFVVCVFLVGVAPAQAANCTQISTGRIPIEDMRSDSYQGYPGGLYPGGSNERPAIYLASGLAAASSIRPINGKIGLISTGMSNATMTFSAFKQVADAYPDKNPALVIVDGAQGGMGVVDWLTKPNAAGSPWRILDQRVQAAGLSPNQVQAMWLYHGEESVSSYGGPFPTDARTLADQIKQVVQIAESKYPNLRMIQVESMTYMGYSATTARQEPMSGYDTQFAAKWLIEDRITGAWTPRSYVDWSFQQWADGASPRNDGFTWLCEDVGDDGVHPSWTGRMKVAHKILDTYLADPTTAWFRV